MKVDDEEKLGGFGGIRRRQTLSEGGFPKNVINPSF